MPWVEFTADFPFHPFPAQTIMYTAGTVALVSKSCAEQAVAAGRAKETARPAKATVDKEPEDVVSGA